LPGQPEAASAARTAEAKRARAEGAEGQGFATQTACLRFLAEAGYKPDPGNFSRAVRDGLIAPDPATRRFERGDLLAFAAQHLRGGPESAAQAAAAREAKLETLRLRNKKLRILLEREERRNRLEASLFVEKGQYKKALAARHAFFKRECELFGPRLAEVFLPFLDLPREERRSAVISAWREIFAEWLNSFVA
jgi:hypothetical protein